MGTGLDKRYRCAVHGGYYLAIEGEGCQTTGVLGDVRAERARQFAKYGTNEGLRDGTGEAWLRPFSLEDSATIEARLREDYEAYKVQHVGLPTWMHLVREEVAEAFAEMDPERLREELVQVAALCVSWVEKIDARGAVAL